VIVSGVRFVKFAEWAWIEEGFSLF